MSRADFSAASHCDVDTNQPVAVKDRWETLVPSEYPHHLGRLSTYEVMSVIGAGGMGVVLKAIGPSLYRVIALKVMSPKLRSNEGKRVRSRK